jgi:hypothetical protein
MKRLFFVYGVLVFAFWTQMAWAGECTNNSWQPTFVRHDRVAPTVYYVTAGGGFIPMANPQQAQETCRNSGVRMTIGGNTCAQRNWGDFGCGCNIFPARNSTCADFHNFLRSQGITIP